MPANETPIDIENIFKFISNHNFDTKKIRKYAVENLSWEKQYQKVLKELFPDI